MLGLDPGGLEREPLDVRRAAQAIDDLLRLGGALLGRRA